MIKDENLQYKTLTCILFVPFNQLQQILAVLAPYVLDEIHSVLLDSVYPTSPRAEHGRLLGAEYCVETGIS